MAQTSVQVAQVEFKAGTNTSELKYLSDLTICGFYVPSDFLGTTLTIKASYADDAAAVNVNDGAGNTDTLTVVAGEYTRVNPAHYAGVSRLQLVSSTNETSLPIIRVAVRVME